MMHALAAYTRDGTVFPVDARLRPRGGEGELLSTPAQLALYFEHEAQAWEALMYTKLRFLAGSQPRVNAPLAMLKILFKRFAADPGFAHAVREMRTKLESAEAPGKSFKASPGGIYDIDFITSFLLVKHGVADKRGTCVTAYGVVWIPAFSTRAMRAALDHAAELVRTVEHVARLVVGRAGKWLPATEHGRKVTEKSDRANSGSGFSGGLENELDRTFKPCACDLRAGIRGVRSSCSAGILPAVPGRPGPKLWRDLINSSPRARCESPAPHLPISSGGRYRRGLERGAGCAESAR